MSFVKIEQQSRISPEAEKKLGAKHHGARHIIEVSLKACLTAKLTLALKEPSPPPEESGTKKSNAKS